MQVEGDLSSISVFTVSYMVYIDNMQHDTHLPMIHNRTDTPMYTENMQSHTPVVNGAMKENKLGDSFCGLLYRMAMPAIVSNMSVCWTYTETCTPEHRVGHSPRVMKGLVKSTAPSRSDVMVRSVIARSAS